MADSVFLTATRISPAIFGKKLTTPKVVQIPVAQIGAIITNPDGGATVKLTDGARVGKQYEVLENQAQINVALDPSSSNPYAQDKNLALAALGGNQGAAAALAAYLTMVNSATVSSAEGVRLPALAGVTKPFVVINSTAVVVKVYPATGETINGAAANVAVNLAAGARLHFCKDTATKWKTATE
jgi:hypothetical protein